MVGGEGEGGIMPRTATHWFIWFHDADNTRPICGDEVGFQRGLTYRHWGVSRRARVVALKSDGWLKPEFIRERNSALLSLDQETIMEFAMKWGTDWRPSCDEVFWRAVHKARTAIPELPQEARDLSEAWLKAHNSESWADAPSGVDTATVPVSADETSAEAKTE